MKVHLGGKVYSNFLVKCSDNFVTCGRERMVRASNNIRPLENTCVGALREKERERD